MAEENQPTRLVRFIFEHEDDHVRLVAQLPVEAAAESLDATLQPEPGYYLEMRTQDNQNIGRVALPQAFPTSAEVFPAQPGDPITRVPAPSRGAFTVVAPAPPSAQRVAVVKVAAPAPNATGVPGALPGLVPAEPEVTDIASFALSPPG
jgi:hypothetical protein